MARLPSANFGDSATGDPDDLEAAGLLFKEGHIPRARLEAEVRRYKRLAGPLAAAQEADAWLSSLRRS